MASGWGHALAAAVGGWKKGKEIKGDEEDRQEERSYRSEQRGRQRQKDSEEDSLKSALKSAAMPVAVEEGANGAIKPATMDNRDVGLPENEGLPNAGLTDGAYAVQGKAFQDRASADAAAQALNAPEAVSTRVAQAFNGGISGEKGTNGTTENRDYSARTSAALAAPDPMDALYRKQVGEMNRGLRNELSPEVSSWKKHRDTTTAREGEQRFNAAQADYMQKEKLRAQARSKELAATSRS